MNRIYLLLLFVCASQTFSIGQSKRGNIAVIGDGVALDFNFSPPSVYPMTSNFYLKFNVTEGSANICDNDGKLLFYTNGIMVWNKDYNTMPNGIELRGNDYTTTSTQIIIVPVPKDPFQYYIITPGWQGKDLVYSLLDMRLDQGRGDIIFKNKLLYKMSTEKVAVIKHASNESLWLITHEYGTNNFRTFLIDEDGLHTDYVLSSVGEKHAVNNEPYLPNRTIYGTNAIGYLKPSHLGDFLASVVTGEMGTVELFRFDNSTGIVSKPIELMKDKILKSYAAEFSPDDSKLYVACRGNGDLFQFNLSSGDSLTMVNSRQLISTRALGSLQLGPDHKIYSIPIVESNSLDRINNPNDAGSACNFQENAISLGQKKIFLGLPELLYNAVDPEIIYEGFCPRYPTTFHLINIKNFESIEWDFGDPASATRNTSTDVSPKHTYADSGYYKIKVKITFADKSVFNYSQRINMLIPPVVSLGNDTTLCDYNRLTLRPQTKRTPQNVLWSDGSTQRTLPITKSGKYWVTIDYGMCVASDTIQVAIIPFPQLSLKDTTLCTGQSLPVSLPAFYQYQWSDGVTNRERVLNSPGTFSVVGKNQCGVRNGKLNLSFIPSLRLDFPKDTLLCYGQNLVLDVKNDVAKYRWQDGTKLPLYTIQSDGAYWVEIYNRCETVSDTIMVGRVSEDKYVIPNVITPNDDGLNDYFVINENLAPKEIKILNRWGSIVYFSSQYDNKWNGESCCNGVYYYVLKDECTQKEIKGWLSVLK